MSSRFAGTVILAVVATPLLAQHSPVARLRWRADSLLQTWRDAQVIANLADSLERERATIGHDTIVVGALHIITNESPLPLREAATRAWPVIDSLYGSAAADLAQRPYIIRAVDPDSTAPRSMLHVGIEVPWELDVQSTTALLLNIVPTAPPDRPFGDWLGGILRPAFHLHEDRAAVYVELVTAPSEPARRCFLGETLRCIDALGLGDTSHLVERWYPSALERRGVAGAFAEFFNHGATIQAFRDCTAGNDTSCSTLLHSLPNAALPKPLSEGARILLVRDALHLGGRDAYRRLLRDPDLPMGDRLARAARVSLDSLVRVWRSAVLANRPAPVALPWWAIGAALGWVSLFAACGLSSSRWRA
jgi:hypothetical protein